MVLTRLLWLNNVLSKQECTFDSHIRKGKDEIFVFFNVFSQSYDITIWLPKIIKTNVYKYELLRTKGIICYGQLYVNQIKAIFSNFKKKFYSARVTLLCCMLSCVIWMMFGYLARKRWLPTYMTTCKERRKYESVFNHPFRFDGWG